MAPSGVGEVADFMEPNPSAIPSDRHRLVRVARVVRGSLPFTLACRPRLDYARAAHTFTMPDDGSALFHGPGMDLHLRASDRITLRADGDDVVADFTLQAGETAAITLTGDRAGAHPPSPACQDFWLGWLRSSRYRGRWQEMVNRSAITLKLLTYASTGAPIAAAMALDEQLDDRADGPESPHGV
ncbi:glycoside hydrolase family 15 protein, partial [Nonomuraea sp. RK-328]|nr:glycoside hydrolase family 15 protein [Nonomuraea sp. RK-328]